MKTKYPQLTISSLSCNPAWQERVKTFAQKEVFYCVSQLISELAKDERYLDDLIPVCIQDDWEAAAIDNGFEPTGDEENLKNAMREYCEENSIEPQTNEAYEHWIVSDWLANKLEEKGEMVIYDFLGLTIWGRCTTGQAIYIDRVINEIYFDMVTHGTRLENLAKELGLTQE